MNIELESCPFYGFKPSLDEEDCLYPTNYEKTLYSLNCYETGGGCGAQVLGWTGGECIERWNTRVENK